MRTIVLFLIAAAAACPQSLDELRRGLATPASDSRIMMRWWWFGPSITKAEIDRDLAKMKEGGIGGVEIQPVYPLSTEGNYTYLSPEFLAMVGYANEKATALGLRVDLTLGSGWPFGGPHIPVTQASGRLRVERIAGKPPALADGEELITIIDNTAYISSRTGMQVKRAALGAEGFVLDHYDRTALDTHLSKVGEVLVKAFGDHPPYAVFSDSLEVYASDWTPDFVRQFQKRRGYDITPHLPALVQDLPESGAVRNDWAKTLAELCNENYLAPLNQWAHDHHTRFRSQTYGVPPVTLASQSLVDLPEGEKPHWRTFTPARWASSAAHLYGKPVVSTETWTWLHSPAYRATPLDMKAEADLHFLEGINQLIGHGWPTPPTTRFYAAAVFNDTNPWYNVMPDIALYLQRMSWLMRQGQPANDVALYIPTADIRANLRLGNVSIDQHAENLPVSQILDAGYNFDYIDDETIERIGIPQPILVLANVERMSAAAAKKIAAYKGKVIVLGQMPSKAPGLNDEAPQLSLPLAANLRTALREALAPDIEAPAGIGFLHRKTAKADIYFVANTTNQPVNAPVKFRAQGRLTVLDPFTLKPAPLTFAPYESRIVIVSSEGEGAPAPAPTLSPALTLDFGDTVWPKNFSGVRAFEAKFVKPEGARFALSFGEGTPVEGSQGRKPGMRAWLESPVREAAVVTVNGKKAGTVWRPPYEVDVTQFLVAGENTVKVEVGNTYINRLAGESLPNYRLLTLRYGLRFEPQDMENLKPLPSGLTQPVQLLVQK